MPQVLIIGWKHLAYVDEGAQNDQTVVFIGGYPLQHAKQANLTTVPTSAHHCIQRTAVARTKQVCQVR